jgi:hypothetical protein
LWVKGPGAADGPRLLGLPAEARFVVGADGALRRPGGRLPVGSLPEGPWLPIADAVGVEAPAHASPARPQPLDLALEPAGAEQPARGLLVDQGALAAWADRASDLRLAGLRVSLRSDGQALVLREEAGPPLPPLRGPRLWVDEPLLVPCGLRWAPRVPAGVVAEVFDLLPGERLLLEAGGAARLPEAAFGPLTRAALRDRLTSAEGPPGPDGANA